MLALRLLGLLMDGIPDPTSASALVARMGAQRVDRPGRRVGPFQEIGRRLLRSGNAFAERPLLIRY
jgi:hypothetical protein